MADLLYLVAKLAKLQGVVIQTLLSAEKLSVSREIESGDSRELRDLQNALYSFFDAVLVFQKWVLYSKNSEIEISSLDSFISLCSPMVQEAFTQINIQIPELKENITFPDSLIPAILRNLQASREAMSSIIHSSSSKVLEESTGLTQELSKSNSFTPQIDMQNDRRRDPILNWLSTVDHEQTHKRVRQSRLNGTGKWILHHGLYTTWKTRKADDKRLLLLGPAGAGKTVLASTIIDDILASQSLNSDGQGLAYLYYESRHQFSHSEITSSLLKQLVAAQPEIPDTIDRFFKAHSREEERAASCSFAELVFQLVALVRDLDGVFIVIDGIDQLADAGAWSWYLYYLLRELDDAGASILLLSREPPFLELWDLEDTPRITVQVPREDIELYMTYKLEMSKMQHLIQGELRAKLLQCVIERSNGMFQFLVWQISILLEHAETRRDIMIGMQDLPNNLEDMYAKILGMICEQPHTYPLAKNVIMCVLHAKRRLSVQELGEVILIDLENEMDPQLDLDAISTPVAIERSCMGLITIDEQLMISFSHPSFQVYLLDNSDKYNWLSLGRQRIAMYCLKYLNYRDFIQDEISVSVVSQMLKDYSFGKYAAENWISHVQDVKQMTGDDTFRLWKERVLKLTLELLRNATKSLWLLVKDLDDPADLDEYLYLHRRTERMPTGLHICATHGLADEAVELLKRNEIPDLESRDFLGATPLCEAIKSHSNDVARILLDANASIHSGDNENSKSLHYAAYYGNTEFVVPLVEKGAAIDEKDNLGMCPLTMAVMEAHIGAVKALLACGADLSVTDDYYNWTAFHHASNSGSLEIAQLLLEHGANFRQTDIAHRTPLHLAARTWSDGLVQILLAAGADVNAVDKTQWTPLHTAARSGRARIVERLLANGADINARSNKQETPTMFAVMSGNLETLEKLLNRWPNLESKTLTGSTALHIAASRDNMPIAKMLIECGAERDPRDNENKMPLDYALSEEMKELFL